MNLRENLSEALKNITTISVSLSLSEAEAIISPRPTQVDACNGRWQQILWKIKSALLEWDEANDPQVKDWTMGKGTCTIKIPLHPQPPKDAKLVGYNDTNCISEELRNTVSWFVEEDGDIWPCNRSDIIECPYHDLLDMKVTVFNQNDEWWWHIESSHELS